MSDAHSTDIISQRIDLESDRPCRDSNGARQNVCDRQRPTVVTDSLTLSVRVPVKEGGGLCRGGINNSLHV
jgi:hypothetical protein